MHDEKGTVMALNYRMDPDLEFLAFLSEEQLRGLARHLTHDTDGSERFVSELLTHESFKKLNGDPEQYKKSWKLIAAELQHFGGDSIVNAMRGQGVPYRVIVEDVASRFHVPTSKTDSAEDVERAILAKVLGDAWEKMSDEERLAFLKEAGLDASRSETSGKAAILKLLKMGGPASYPLVAFASEMISRMLMRQTLTAAACYGFVRSASAFAGPIGIAVAALTTLPALTGTAYRVTVPVVFHLASLRHADQQRDHF
jgi:uncharacterized protein YaaW (UPF0174 family)